MNKPERFLTIAETMHAIGRSARAAQRELALATTDAKNRALTEAANALRARRAEILDANVRDLAAARDRGTAGSFLDRLMLDNKRIEAVANGLVEIAVNRGRADWDLGLTIGSPVVVHAR